jgi:hypothetical protein
VENGSLGIEPSYGVQFTWDLFHKYIEARRNNMLRLEGMKNWRSEILNKGFKNIHSEIRIRGTIKQ